MTLFYSPSTGGFYSEAIHGERLIADRRFAGTLVENAHCLIPADAVEISEAHHAELMDAQAGGMAIVAGQSGPIAITPVQSTESKVAQNRQRRDRLLTESDWTQLNDSLAGETDYKFAMAQWRQLLRDMDLVAGIFPSQPVRAGTANQEGN